MGKLSSGEIHRIPGSYDDDKQQGLLSTSSELRPHGAAVSITQQWGLITAPTS